MNGSGTTDITLSYSNGQKSNGEKQIETYFEFITNNSSFLTSINQQPVGFSFDLIILSEGVTVDPSEGDYVSSVNKKVFAYDINADGNTDFSNPFSEPRGYIVFKSSSEDERPIIGWLYVEVSENDLKPKLINVGIKYIN